MSEKSVVIVDAKRTAVGNFLGGFSTLQAHDLGKVVLENLISSNDIDASDISEVIMGQVLNAGKGQNPIRQAAIAALIPNTVPAYGISQVCGSGLKAVGNAFIAIKSGESNIILAGGQENMSQSVHTSFLRNGIKMGNGSLVDTMIQDGLTDAFSGVHMGITAENIAKKYSISRQEQDEFAASSQQKAEKAQKENIFKDEIVSVVVPNRKGDITVDTDEFPRHGTTAQSLGKLRPAFNREGTVTAGNASGINDGAAALLIMSEYEAEKKGLKPLAKIKSWGQAGVDPDIMGTGPIPAVKNALAKANWSIDDLDLIEANEAFAAQAISVNKELGWNIDIVNVNGGAIAIGHPIGASGARILVTLLHEMKRRKSQSGKNLKGLATLCIGGGMGVALCVESI